MPLTSDLQLDASKFDIQNISEQTKKYNEQLRRVMESGPKWFEVGAEKYRQMRWNGETPIPKPTVLENGVNSTIPSREHARSIPIRTFHAPSGKPAGVFYHIHGGGWVLQSEAYQDLMLQYYSEHANLTVVSVGYRLAPEHPYPQGNEDCFDVGEYLVDHAAEAFGAPLLFMGGDSAGAHLSAVTCFHLRARRPDFIFKGLVLNFGVFNISNFLPSVLHFNPPLILDLDIMQGYVDAYTPNMTPEQRRDPMISPLYQDLTKLTLPPALFSCGTTDPLVDDSVMMCTRWVIAGHQSILKMYPGAAHGFTGFPIGGTEQTEENLKDIIVFLKDQL